MLLAFAGLQARELGKPPTWLFYLLAAVVLRQRSSSELPCVAEDLTQPIPACVLAQSSVHRSRVVQSFVRQPTICVCEAQSWWATAEIKVPVLVVETQLGPSTGGGLAN